MRRTALLGLIVGLTLIGFALRFYRLNAVSLRGDEAFTVLHWMREPLGSTLANIATVDPQPPLSYILYRGWALIMGSSEYVARMLPALISVLGISVMYALGRHLQGWRLGLLAAFLWAVNPYQIWHAQDARNYAIWVVFSLLAIWLALRALRQERRVDWALYVIVGAVAAYIYYLELFVLVVLNIYVFVSSWRDRRLLFHWIGSQIAIGLILVPWYLQPRLLLTSGYGGTAGSFDPRLLLTRFVPTLVYGETLSHDLGLIADRVAPLLVAALLVGLMLWWRRNRKQVVLFGLLGTIPLILLAVVSTRLNIFTPRYVLASAPAYVLILGVLILGAKPRLVRGGLFFVVVLVGLFSLNNYYFASDYAKSPNWRALAGFLSTQVKPDEWVTQAAADASFTFYCGEYQITPNCSDQLPANPKQSTTEIDRLLTIRSESHKAIWYVAQPLNWSNAQVAENWLQGHMQLVRNTSVGGLRAQEFKPWTITVDEIASAPLATFGDSVELVGAQTFVEPTGSLTVWLYWRPLHALDNSLKIFLHLTNAGGIAAQDDHYPQDGRADTTSWETATVYRDIYTLPAVAAGDYTLRVGFYDPETNRRLPVGDGDSFTVQIIHLK